MNNTTATSRAQPGALVRVNEVTRRYQRAGQLTLDNVSLQVAAGRRCPSGSGKSTPLNQIAGLNRPISGTDAVTGQRIQSRRSAVFQLLPQADDIPA